MEETSTDSEVDRQRVAKKALVENDRSRALARNSNAIAESNNTAEEKKGRKYFIRKEQAEELAREKRTRENAIASTSVANDKARLYEPLASLKLYGVTCQVKRREKSAGEKLTKQSGTAEIRIDDRKSAEFEEDIGMVEKNVQVSAHEILKSAAILEKNIQTNPQKSERYKRHDNMSRIDTRISRAAGSKKRGKKEEKRQERWIDRCKRRKQRY